MVRSCLFWVSSELAGGKLVADWSPPSSFFAALFAPARNTGASPIWVDKRREEQASPRAPRARGAECGTTPPLSTSHKDKRSRRPHARAETSRVCSSRQRRRWRATEQQHVVLFCSAFYRAYEPHAMSSSDVPAAARTTWRAPRGPHLSICDACLQWSSQSPVVSGRRMPMRLNAYPEPLSLSRARARVSP